MQSQYKFDFEDNENKEISNSNMFSSFITFQNFEIILNNLEDNFSISNHETCFENSFILYFMSNFNENLENIKIIARSDDFSKMLLCNSSPHNNEISIMFQKNNGIYNIKTIKFIQNLKVTF